MPNFTAHTTWASHVSQRLQIRLKEWKEITLLLMWIIVAITMIGLLGAVVTMLALGPYALLGWAIANLIGAFT